MNQEIEGYIVDKVLGQGSFGQVYLVHSKENPQQYYALKLQFQTNENEEILLNQFKGCKFSNVVNVIRTFKFQQMQFSYDCILMDYCNSNDLYSLLFTLHRKHMLTFEQKKDLIFQVAYGIYEIHKEEIIHRDIKPQNIMLHCENDKLITKICDFGLSKKYQKNNINTVNIGTPLYMAPEMLNQDEANNDNYDKSIDVWAFGVIMYDFFNDQMLFIGKNIIEIQNKILTPINPNIAKCFNDQTLAEVFLGCVVIQSEKRLKIEDVLNKLDKDRFQQLVGKEDNLFCSVQNSKDRHFIKNRVILRGFIRDQNYVNRILIQIDKGANAQFVISSLNEKADELFKEL